MKKTFKIFLVIILLIPFMNLNCVSSEYVDYEVESIIIDAKLDIAGSLNVKEAIVLDGTFNGYERDILYKNDALKKFTGDISDFYGSDIYNASKISIEKVGVIKKYDTLDITIFNNEVIESKEKQEVSNGSKLMFTKKEINNGYRVRMYNETENSKTVFYIEYTIVNLSVVHNDVAEMYYNFLGEDFDNNIDNVIIRTTLPLPSNEEIRVWAHGPLNGEGTILSEKNENNEDIYYGAYLTVTDLPANTPVDLRMTYSKSLYAVDHPTMKKSNIDALDKIIEVETERANEANAKREHLKKIYNFATIINVAYIIILIYFIIRVYTKYDKEFKSTFLHKYNREFIEDYDVEVIEYLMNKQITDKAFSTSILNLIYKKKIKAEKLNTKKEDYMLTKLSDKNVSDNEKYIMDMLFDTIGNGSSVSLSGIKKYAKKVSTAGTSIFLTKYNSWKQKVEKVAINQKFYEDNTKVKVIYILYGLIGFILFVFDINIEVKLILTMSVLLLSIIFVIYIAVFTKRTIKGNEHYVKWMAFKKFLEDFGRFNEKELPEIALWERYLVYANIFGLSKKVQETMKIKITEFTDGSDLPSADTSLFNYVLHHNIAESISSGISSSIISATSAVMNSASSSGSGFGGGFSGGGGFGGGGGGGRGF